MGRPSRWRTEDCHLHPTRCGRTFLHLLFALPCPFIALGRRMDENVVKLGGITVIVGGLFAMLPVISLAVTIIPLGAGLALVGLGMKSPGDNGVPVSRRHYCRSPRRMNFVLGLANQSS